MDIFERLKKDHERMRDLLRAVEGTPVGESERRRALFDELRREIWAHARVEEAVFYAPLRQAEATGKDVHEGLTEHRLVDELAGELGDMPADGVTWSARFQVLGEMLRHHMREEEQELFADARRTLDPDRADRLGAEFDDRKRKALDALAPLRR